MSCLGPFTRTLQSKLVRRSRTKDQLPERILLITVQQYTHYSDQEHIKEDEIHFDSVKGPSLLVRNYQYFSIHPTVNPMLSQGKLNRIYHYINSEQPVSAIKKTK